MSEYQYYEFRAVDRALTDEEQRAVSSLSSRVDPHPWRAVFVYHYSDLRADPKELLTAYYDAMFYVANWGSTRLMFRFPRDLIVTSQIEHYCVEDYVAYDTVGDYIVLDIEWHDEGGYVDWVEGEGTLDALLPLRDDILRQDYRALYLAWLASVHMWEDPHEVHEPLVPSGLQRLTPALQRFMEVFHVDEALVTVAARASDVQQKPSSRKLRELISALPRNVADEWLLKLAKGEEAHLSLTFQRFLNTGREIKPSTQAGRTAGELLALANEEKSRRRQRAAAEAEARRVRELEAFAPRAEDTWTFVRQLLEQGYGKYDEVYELLVRLRDLAVYQGTEATYEARLQEIRDTYPQRKALQKRLDKARLT